MKNSNDTFGNRTRDLPACGAMPQPTAPPRAPVMRRNTSNIGAGIHGEEATWELDKENDERLHVYVKDIQRWR